MHFAITRGCNYRPLHAARYGTSRHYIAKNTDLDVTTIRKQTSQEICFGQKSNLCVFESSGIVCSQCRFFGWQQLKQLFRVALDEDFDALCKIKVQFKYCENILVLENTLFKINGH